MAAIIPVNVGEDELGHVEWAGFVEDVPVFASAAGKAHFLAEHAFSIHLHDGLLAASLSHDNKRLITSGEDGKINALSNKGEVEELYHNKGKWIDRLTTGPNGLIGASWGREGVVVTQESTINVNCERTIEGLAFAPKGMRLAIARYNGVDLQWVNRSIAPQFLEWNGAHIGVVFSPDGKYVVSTMQENALHGWRISDNKHMRMSGYPAKVHSVSWSPKGKWLATSGAPAAIVWPFSGKDGPMGKSPKELASMSNKLVSRVCFHPQADVVAIGYDDGMIMAVRIEDGNEVLLRNPAKGMITSLNWDKTGRQLAFGSQAGEAGLIDISA